jgi:hypothetical protein
LAEILELLSHPFATFALQHGDRQLIEGRCNAQLAKVIFTACICLWQTHICAGMDIEFRQRGEIAKGGNSGR